jgi:deazaflavin-dependent oxidoreductase (nitroreductase family)
MERLPQQRTLRLTTRGRKSGAPRTVTIWFIATDPHTLLVQHTSPRPAQWYRNLLRDPEVQVDLGDGPVPARATPITERAEIDDVLRHIRRKYPAAWLFRLLGWNRRAVAARLVLQSGRG